MQRTRMKPARKEKQRKAMRDSRKVRPLERYVIVERTRSSKD
jgi:hypothetical protein